MNRTAMVLGLVVLAAGSALGNGADPWPAEAIGDATNLTGVPGNADFQADLSGAFWNSSTRTLYVCRNSLASAQLWALIEDGSGGFVIPTDGGMQRAEWNSFGDLEGVTQADLGEAVVYVIIEGEERIKEYDIGTFGTKVLNNDWNTSPFLPLSGGSGAEGITFVPDSALAAQGFVDQDGNPYTSTGGMNGLMFVGHQNGGGIYVFDLDRNTGTFTFVGEYLTDYTEVAGLEFDRSTERLYVYHDSNFDVLAVLDLTSQPVAGQVRRFNTVETFCGPDNRNNEGIAVVSSPDCDFGRRGFFMTVDGGGAQSLLWYETFTHGCPQPDCLEGLVNAAGSGPEDVLLINSSSGGAGREVHVQVGDAVTFSVDPSSVGPDPARHWFYAWLDPPTSDSILEKNGQILGCFGNPTPFHVGQLPQPIRCIRGMNVPAVVCNGVTTISPPGTDFVPWSLTKGGGFANPGVLTVQAVVEDAGATNTLGFSVTNGVVLHIDP